MHLTRPLHLGPNSALPERPGVPSTTWRRWCAGRWGTTRAWAACLPTATPLTGRCTAEDATLDEDLQPVQCLAQGGNAAAVDFDLKTADSSYGLRGQLDGSQTVGGLPERTLRDGTLLRRGAHGLRRLRARGEVRRRGLPLGRGLRLLLAHAGPQRQRLPAHAERACAAPVAALPPAQRDGAAQGVLRQLQRGHALDDGRPGPQPRQLAQLQRLRRSCRASTSSGWRRARISVAGTCAS